ncbi:MAG: DUF4142 domain-containing protein [Chitinophagaceae bacterium]
MKKKFGFLLALPFALLACNNEGKDSVEKADSTNNAKMDSSTANNPAQTISTDAESTSFMTKAADAGMAEVQMGEMAQQKAVNAKVKDFATMMIHDHSAVNDQVKALAAQRNVTLPDSVSDDHKKKMNDLMKKTGKDFDKAYVSAMVDGHKKVLDMFQDASKNVKDTEVKTLIDNTIPKIQMHLDSIQAIQKLIK